MAPVEGSAKASAAEAVAGCNQRLRNQDVADGADIIQGVRVEKEDLRTLWDCDEHVVPLAEAVLRERGGGVQRSVERQTSER